MLSNCRKKIIIQYFDMHNKKKIIIIEKIIEKRIKLEKVIKKEFKKILKINNYKINLKKRKKCH